MTYEESIQLLYNQFQSFQKKGKQAFSGKLGPIKSLCEKLNNPQDNYPVVHLAGTNGKGSTASVIASIFKEHGLTTGLYTSPHLYDFRERIRVDGKMITKKDVAKLTQDLIEKNQNQPLSFFEMTTAMAFQYFSDQKIDVAVLETGLGGRLDSTNICKNKLAAVITPIGMDHTNILGDHLTEIAMEKAGIIPEAKFCITSMENDEVNPALNKYCDDHNIPFTVLSAPKKNYSSDLDGEYQQQNIHLGVEAAVRCLELLNKELSEDKIKGSLLNIKFNSGLIGRYEKVGSSPDIIFDVAHNEQGVTSLFKSIDRKNYNAYHLVCGFSSDKDLKSIFKIFNDQRHFKYYLTTPGGERGIEKKHYQQLIERLSLAEYYYFEHPQHALNSAQKKAKENDLIIVFGSFFLFEKIDLIL